MPSEAIAAPQTFVFADLAGYTALTEVHGDEFAADTAEEFRAATNELLAEADGEEVKAIGDGLMLRVPEAMEAIRLGALLVARNSQHRSLGVRVGMHTGPAVRRGDDWFGATVNVAARVVAIAKVGEVLVTAATREAAGPDLCGTLLDPHGTVRLRHVAEPIQLCAVRLDDPDLPIDPVCHMALDPARAATSREHQGSRYRFCSHACAEVFDQDPARYLG
jgi:adenylate cyclase